MKLEEILCFCPLMKEHLKFYVVNPLGVKANTTTSTTVNVCLKPHQKLCNSNVPVSGLIGNDQYFRIATGESTKINEKIGAIETITGWIVRGQYKTSFNTDR